MTQSVFNNYFLERYHLLKVSVITTYQIDTAYIGEKWGSLLSTTIYTLTYLLFIHVLFANVKTVASYTHNEMLFFTFIGQVSFYTFAAFTRENWRNFIADVNQGNLDMILIKPVPSLFFINYRRISILTFIKDGLPTFLIVLLIQWNQLSLSLFSFIVGMIIFFCGQITINMFQFLFTLPAIWFGEAEGIFGISFDFLTEQVPFEGLTPWLKILFTTLIPTFFSVSVTTSVILGKSNPINMLLLSISVAMLAILVKNYLWKIALRNYTSASS